MDDELIIKTVPQQKQKLFLEAIKTLPVQVKYGEIEMIANGISGPRFKEENREERYLSECEKNNIIPFSNIKLRHQKNPQELFVPDSDKIVTLYEDISEQTRQVTINGLVKGGRIHKVKIDTGRPYEEGFEKFRQEFLGEMLKNGYQLSEGDLWLSYHHQTGYSQGDYADTTIKFGRYINGGDLELRLVSFPKEDKKIIVPWFKKLKNKYNQSAQLKIKV